MSSSKFKTNGTSDQVTQALRGSSNHRVSVPSLNVEKTSLIDGWIIGKSGPIQRLKGMVVKVAPRLITILICGETGTGKEVIARATHHLSPRADKIFIPINCGAIPENLIEEELFGHVKGSFTGASANREGVFEAADGGTIFLDEIDKTTRAAQVRLLRVLQEHKVRPVGTHRERDVNVRVIVATNRDLQEAVKEGLFLEDLYYRIKVVQLWVPPLRERLDDIPLLVRHKLREMHQQQQDRTKLVEPFEFTDGAVDLLCKHTWPGNVRELLNVVEAVTTLADDSLITEAEVREVLIGGEVHSSAINGWRKGVVLASSSVHIPTDLELRQALVKTRGNVSAAARMLGLPRSTFRSRLEKFEQGQDQELG